ncbi:hypothetical protein ABW19_dt0204292 [Dactylella cylindrospora]|nr:hypothetical protein ABW19_dt0204292 [Dactylella cylindrospora]
MYALLLLLLLLQSTSWPYVCICMDWVWLGSCHTRTVMEVYVCVRVGLGWVRMWSPIVEQCVGRTLTGGGGTASCKTPQPMQLKGSAHSYWRGCVKVCRIR